ncbi:MAG TPA: ester cyclase [Candidatus Tectomicrobia bacterium]
MSAEENKTISRRLFEEAFNKGDLSVVDEIFAPDVVGQAADAGTTQGSQRRKATITEDRTLFPDLHFTVEDQLADGDKVLTRWVARGTHKGQASQPHGIGRVDLIRGMPPTNKQVTFAGMDIHRIQDGKIVETWRCWDRLGLLQQLGAVPPPGQGGS